MNKFLLLSLLFTSYLGAQTITVAVAANVSYAMEKLKKEFLKTHKDTKLRIIIGGSGKLTAQIKHGAPYDIFLSANMKYPNSLYKDKVAITKPVVYAQGSLAFLSKSKKDFSKGIELLTDSSIRLIAVANPKTAPYGKAAIEAIKNYGIYDDIKKKFIYGESISQTLSYTVSAADIGIVSKSALFSCKMEKFKKGINWVEVDSKLYTPIEQGIVILKHAKDNNGVREFYNFMLSDDAKKILTHYGYIVR